MFEKEAEEYASNLLKDVNCNMGNPRARQINSIDVEQAFKDGAEFGYNNANEWHNLEENPTDLPKENMKQVIVKLSDGSYEMGWYCIHKGIWYNDECDGDTLEYYYFDEKIKVVKWKEIKDD